MKVDHGGVQPLEMLATHKVLTRLVPIFVNCAAPPRPTFDRVRALGRAVGEWARKRPERIVIVGSGGLSHDPPLPSIATATGAAGKRLREGGDLSYADRLARQIRVLAGGTEFSSGKSKPRPLNPEWDRKVMAEFAAGNLQALDGSGDDAITEKAGCGSHELRCWIAALSAVAGEGSYRAEPLFYAPVNEWFTGMGVLTASAAGERTVLAADLGSRRPGRPKDDVRPRAEAGESAEAGGSALRPVIDCGVMNEMGGAR
jgi:2,3-dihydroxyphenylpropionate 1,2-dioxygenase